MRTHIDKDAHGEFFIATNDGETYIYFRTRTNAERFKKMVKVLPGNTLQERHDYYINNLISIIMEQQKVDHWTAFGIVGHNFG